jgi:tetrahydromethanopterin S-methyltransferase subunit A
MKKLKNGLNNLKRNRMKRLLCLMVIMIVISGCYKTENVNIRKTKTVIEGQHIEVYMIDGCEYIGKISGGNTDILTHKGNCKFCEQRSY